MAATSAARLRAAADAAALHVGYSSAAPGSDRNERQLAYNPSRASRARVVVELELQREDRARGSGAHLRRGPSPLFLAQYMAQESANVGGDAVIRAQATSRYPSLGFDQDILLPGGPDVVAADVPRVDILV